MICTIPKTIIQPSYGIFSLYSPGDKFICQPNMLPYVTTSFDNWDFSNSERCRYKETITVSSTTTSRRFFKISLGDKKNSSISMQFWCQSSYLKSVEVYVGTTTQDESYSTFKTRAIKVLEEDIGLYTSSIDQLNLKLYNFTDIGNDTHLGIYFSVHYITSSPRDVRLYVDNIYAY